MAPAQHVAAVLIARLRAVGDRHRERADVVSDDSVSHVDSTGVVVANLAAKGRCRVRELVKQLESNTGPHGLTE